MIVSLTGTPVSGTATLTNAAPGPTAIALVLDANGAAFTLAANQRVYVVSFALASNDPTQALITVDAGTVGTVRKLASIYLSASQPPVTLTFAPGTCVCAFGSTPRATAASVTSGKQVLVTLAGYIATT